VGERRRKATTRALRMLGVHLSASWAKMKRLRRVVTTFSKPRLQASDSRDGLGGKR